MTDFLEPEGDALSAATTPPRRDPAPVTPNVLPLASVIAKPASSSGRGSSLLVLLAGAIAVGGLSFAGGRLTAPAVVPTNRVGGGQLPGGQLPGGQLPGNGQGFPGRGDGFGGVSLSGTVSAVSADSITLDLASGTSITIPLNGETTYHAATSATAGDVTVGSEVRVTPGGRAANPGGSFDPAASPGPGASGVGFEAATDVTVVAP